MSRLGDDGNASPFGQVSTVRVGGGPIGRRGREPVDALDTQGLHSNHGESGETVPVLEVKDLRVSFAVGGQELRAVTGVSFALGRAQTLGIVGESGSGKSVTARAILGLLPKTRCRMAGSVRLLGDELVGRPDSELRRRRGADMSMVFQDPTRSLDPTMRIGDQITEALRAHTELTRAQSRDRAIELLQMVRIPSARQRFYEYPHQLSGGMRQRVMIAIALSCHPRLLIADEPTTALDVTTQAQIMELLKELQASFHMALVLISHDIGVAARYTDYLAVMYAGRIVEEAPTERLFASVRMPYTRGLLDSRPRRGIDPHEPLPVLSGRPPDPLALPTGCPFHPRCSRAQARCTAETPGLEEEDPGHRFACFFPL